MKKILLIALFFVGCSIPDGPPEKSHVSSGTFSFNEGDTIWIDATLINTKACSVGVKAKFECERTDLSTLFEYGDPSDLQSEFGYVGSEHTLHVPYPCDLPLLKEPYVFNPIVRMSNGWCDTVQRSFYIAVGHEQLPLTADIKYSWMFNTLQPYTIEFKGTPFSTVAFTNPFGGNAYSQLDKDGRGLYRDTLDNASLPVGVYHFAFKATRKNFYDSPVVFDSVEIRTR